MIYEIVDFDNNLVASFRDELARDFCYNQLYNNPNKYGRVTKEEK